MVKASLLGVRLGYHREDYGKLLVLLTTGLLLSVAVAASLAWYIATVGGGHRRGPVRNVVLMISDGFGPASQTLARNYNQYVKDLPEGTQLPLDTILVGSSRTRSSSSFVTDSAAGATAFACILKTYNGAIGVDPSGVPCGTVLEAAKDRGMFTGLVATSRITHATPASFSAHVGSRGDEDDIAVQQIGEYVLGRRVDLMFGGGYCHFLPNTSASSCRSDQKDVIASAKQLGWNVAIDKASFDQIDARKASLPILNLFTPDHMSYNIDRDPAVEPSLTEMSKMALELLERASRKSGKGFFLMIEGSRIDMAAHSNDPATHIQDIFAYNEAINHVKSFVDKHPDTVMISVSDHETGGLSVGNQLGPAYPVYDWYPQQIINVQHSGEFIARELKAYTGPDIQGFVKDTVFGKWLGYANYTSEDVAFLSNTTKLNVDLENYVGTIVSNAAGLGWATHGHSAVDVNLYAYGANADELSGNHENTEIGRFIARHLRLNVDKVTRDLKGWIPGHVATDAHGNFDAKHYHAGPL
ncbi:alkaline-phosphatase-like protein [Entophlyctis helioformis]|nr:alkaline-phosphatase-like protein [Entophlyctis helioformis]